MLYKIDKQLRQRLLAERETGMGYQRVYIGGGQYVVLNSIIGMDTNELWLPTAEDLHSLEELLTAEEREKALDAAISRLSDLPIVAGTIVNVSQEQDPAGQSASEVSDSAGELNSDFDIESHGSYLSNTSLKEKFVRFSAFSNDLRIRQDGSILAGTYATTLVDATVVPSGLAAVARYALPNPWPALYAFDFSASAGTSIFCGTVAPQFGQSGGGVEVFFPDELPANTVGRPRRLPER